MPAPAAASTVDWAQLNTLTGAGAWTASTSQSLTYAGLRVAISDVVARIAQDFGAQPIADGIQIYCDTLVIDLPTVEFQTPALQVVAREVVVEPPQAVPVILKTTDSLAGAQWLIWSVSGAPFVMVFEVDGNPPGASVPTAPIALDPTQPMPQIVSADSAAAAATASNQLAALAGVFGFVAGYQALAASFQAATLLLETDPALATAMLRWVVACSSAVAASASSPGPAAAGGLANYAGLFQQSTALLIELQSHVAGTRYVPLLSTTFYADEVAGLLPAASDYQQTLDDVATTTSTQTTLAEFAKVQAKNQQAVEAALQAALTRIVANEHALGDQLIATTDQFSAQLDTAKAAKTTFQAGLQSYKTQAIVSAVVDTLVTIGEVAVAGFQLASGAGAGAGSATVVSVATTAAAAATKAGPSLLGSADGLLQVAKPLFSLAANVATGGKTLVTSVEQAVNGPGGSAPALPGDLSGIGSIDVLGLNPVTYWQAFRTQAENDLQPAVSASVGGAEEFLNALRLLSTYGAAVGSTQLALIRVQGRAADAGGRLQAAQASQQNWTALAATITNQEQVEQAQAAAAQRAYVNVKRAIFVAVQAYNEAFFYQWLAPSTISVSLDMDYASIAQACQNLQTDLPALLTGSGTGPVTPPQDFSALALPIRLAGSPNARWDAASSTATWNISLFASALPGMLGGSAAIYLETAQFTLPGAVPDPGTGLVELSITTSGNYQLQANGTTYDFVSTPIQMQCIYAPPPPGSPPGTPPVFHVSWQFASSVAALYLKPSPFTQWTLTLKTGTCAAPGHVALTLGGVFLQS